MKGGRPPGSTIPLLRSAKRFEIAVWMTAVANGMGRLEAANLADLRARRPRPAKRAATEGAARALADAGLDSLAAKGRAFAPRVAREARPGRLE
jgi:hypothetical protein